MTRQRSAATGIAAGLGVRLQDSGGDRLVAAIEFDYQDGMQLETVTRCIDGNGYADVMRFSRDNLAIANRPGEFVNAQKFFGLNNDGKGRMVSLWSSSSEYQRS